MATKGRKPERVDSNPYEQIIEITEAAGIDQVRVQLQRRNDKGQLKNVEFFHLPLNDVPRIEEIVQERWGGGHFEALLQHPADFKQRYFTYIFDGEGPEIQPQPRSNYQQQQQPIWNGQQWLQPPPSPVPPPNQFGVHPMTGAPVSVGYPGYPPMSPYGQPMGSYGLQGYTGQQQAQGPSVNEERLRSELENTKAQAAQLAAQAAEERRRWEDRDREERLRREIDETRRKSEETTNMILARLETLGKDESSGTMQMMMKMQENSQNMYDRMSSRELEQGRMQLESIKSQAESDLAYRKQTMEMLAAMQDPNKSLDFFHRMGEQTANTLNMMLQIAQSGLLGGKEEGNPVVETIQQAIGGLQQFGTEWIDSQKTQSQNAAAQARGYAGQGVPPRALPPQTQQRQGQPPMRPQQPPQQKAPGRVVMKGELPATMKDPLAAIGRALMMREDPQIVGEMIFNLADHHRYFHMLPPEWEAIFTDPKTTIIAVLKAHAPLVKFSATDPYLIAISNTVLGIERDLQRELESTRNEQGQHPPQEDEMPPGVIGTPGSLRIIDADAIEDKPEGGDEGESGEGTEVEQSEQEAEEVPGDDRGPR
jgi:hypothetical protein